ncbi:MAG TPA: transposase, partial [Blastocatellia bacterium]|nr:transposase [Blastocatellia bacterium]
MNKTYQDSTFSTTQAGDDPLEAPARQGARQRLLNFYDYPSEHWRQLRKSNVIESPFAAVRLRMDAAKRFRTVKSEVHLIWQLLMKQEKKWRRF